MEKLFSPEFRNRLDQTIFFGKLAPSVIQRVVEKFLDELDGQLAEKNVTIEVSDAAKKWLGEKGYDEAFGARPMARLIQHELKAPLANELLFGKLSDGGTANVDVIDASWVLKINVLLKGNSSTASFIPYGKS